MNMNLTNLIGQKVRIKTVDGALYTGVYEGQAHDSQFFVLSQEDETYRLYPVSNVIFIEKNPPANSSVF